MGEMKARVVSKWIGEIGKNLAVSGGRVATYSPTPFFTSATKLGSRRTCYFRSSNAASKSANRLANSAR